MQNILISLLTAAIVVGIMYLDGMVCQYNRSKGYFVKLFVFTFLSCYGVCYLFHKNRMYRGMFGGYNRPLESIHTGMPRF